MIPMRTSTIFKSRWMALIWSAGILWVAYNVAGAAPQDSNASANSEQANDATGAAITSDDANRLAEELNSF